MRNFTKATPIRKSSVYLESIQNGLTSAFDIKDIEAIIKLSIWGVDKYSITTKPTSPNIPF
jgi:hypothetical protein